VDIASFFALVASSVKAEKTYKIRLVVEPSGFLTTIKAAAEPLETNSSADV